MKIKRFSLLAGIAALVTVGSVYATWDYITGGNIEGADTTLGVEITTKKETTGVAGALSFTETPTLTINHAGDYVPVLEVDGDIKVTYTPATGSQVNAVTCTISVNWLTGTTDEYKALFTFTAIEQTFTAGTVFTIPEATLKANIACAATVLSTPTLYDAYAGVLATPSCGFAVTATAVAA